MEVNNNNENGLRQKAKAILDSRGMQPENAPEDVKSMLEELSIPTAEYRIVENDEVIEDSLKQWGEGVLKWAEYGYDGHGTLI